MAASPTNMAHITTSREAGPDPGRTGLGRLLAKVAHGLADDLLTTMVLARDCRCSARTGDEQADVGEPGHAALAMATLTVGGGDAAEAPAAASRPAARPATSDIGPEEIRGRPDRLPAAEGAGRQKVH